MDKRTAIEHAIPGHVKTVGTGGGGASGRVAAEASTTATAKPKRVRTGCLTCRERHLKCDEGTPDCLNCRKSNRECRRGVRLNFIDVQVKSPPYIPPTVEWSVQFQDESRLIASEYQGGLGRYARLDQQAITPPREAEVEVALQQPPDDASLRSAVPFGSSRVQQMQNVRGMYYPSNIPLQNQVDYSGYEDSRPRITSRKNSDAFLSMGPGPSLASIHSGPGGTGAGFNLATLQDQQFTTRNDIPGGTHAYKSSDVSSVASSLVPQGVAPSSSGSFHGGPGGSGPNAPDALALLEPDKATGERDFLNTEEEIHYMHVFIEEVGVWMDSLDNNKHFSRIIPYHALKSPMLLNALLACGVKHLTLVNSQYSDDRALFYYDTATTQLLRTLQNPDRNMVECATTAVVLNVYEIMSEKPAQRMSHIAGARALIRECGWNARSEGIGAACFWLNIGMEVLSCLAFNWQTAWDPDQWGLDMDVLLNMEGGNADVDTRKGGTGSMDLGGNGAEELWVHRIFYIVAKIANFRANIPRFQEPSPHDEQVRLQSRYAEWKRLRGLCDTWNNNCPRPMRPYGYASPNPSRPGSAFPNIWLIKRAAVIGRLYYHTAMCLLAQIDPLSSRDNEQNRTIQIHHAHQVCGIVAHTKDRGVASVAIRSLAIASSVLTKRHEQEEVLAILDRINKETGWRLGKVHDELKKAWNWEGFAAPGASLPIPQSSQKTQGTSGPPITNPFFNQQQQQNQQSSATTTAGPTPMVMATAAAPMAAPRPRPMVNPLLAQADFNLPNHPYQNWYEPPNRSNAAYSSQGFWPTQ